MAHLLPPAGTSRLAGGCRSWRRASGRARRRKPHRLEAELIRDAILVVGETLDSTMFGPGTLDENSRRRSIYFTVKRSKIMPMLQVFDAPDALQGTPERPSTTIAPQALFLLNNSAVQASARGFARRIAPDAQVSAERA